MTKKEMLAFTAGIIEGDGCIMISHPHGNFKYYSMRLEVAQKDGRLLDKMLGLWGGSIRNSQNGYGVGKWQLSGEKAAFLLKRLIPYFVAKKAQAEIAVRWFDHHKTGKYHFEAKDYEELRALKKVIVPSACLTRLAAETKRVNRSIRTDAIVHPNGNSTVGSVLGACATESTYRRSRVENQLAPGNTRAA